MYRSDFKRVKDSKYTTLKWDTNELLVVKLNGNWTIAVNVLDDDCGVYAPYEVVLGENNVPVIDVKQPIDESILEGGKIDEMGKLDANSLECYEEGPVLDKSTFKFSGFCVDESVRTYFAKRFHETALNNHGLAIVLKLFEKPYFQKSITERLRPANEDEIIEQKKRIMKNVEKAEYTTRFHDAHKEMDYLEHIMKGKMQRDKTPIFVDLEMFEFMLEQGNVSES